MAAEDKDLNRDPLTDEPGAHPAGTGVGAAGGALAGGAVGSVAGPIGAAVGGAVGAVAGGLAGKAAGEAVNPTAEEAAAVGSMRSAGNESGDRDDVVDALNDLAECCKDGEYGFRACAEQAKRADLKSVFLQRADDCRGGAQELYEQIRGLGGKVHEGGSAAGAMHRGWVAVKAALSTYDDKAVLEEAERGEDNAVARYRKTLKKPLPAGIKLIVERQMQGVQRNHDQIKMLRDQARASA